MCFSPVREVKVNLDYFFKRRSETRKYRRQGKQLKSELLELRKDTGRENTTMKTLRSSKTAEQILLKTLEQQGSFKKYHGMQKKTNDSN